jgi:SRR1
MPYVTSDAPKRAVRLKPNVTAIVVRAAEILAESAWWTATAVALTSVNTTPSAIDQRRTRLVCLGLGSFVGSDNARWQMGAALRLREVLGGEKCIGVVADPAMTADDEAVARLLGFSVEYSLAASLAVGDDVASEEKRDENSSVVLFMPHCERRLYNDVMRRMWTPYLLGRAVLLGNSFELFYGAGQCAREMWSFMDAVVGDRIAVEVPCLNAVKSPSYQAFNDLAVTRFDASKSKSMSPDEVWSWRPHIDVDDDQAHWDKSWGTAE